MTSAAFSINGEASLEMALVDVDDDYTIELDSVDGVNVSSVRVIATDETTTVGDWVIADATATSTTIHTPLTEGCAALIEWRVNGGTRYDTRTGRETQDDLVKTAKICVPTSDGRVVLVAGETYETDPTYGWIGPFNSVQRDFAGVAGFNAQAATVNIATTSTNGTVNMATRAGAATNLGNTTGAIAASASTATITGATSVSLVGATTNINASGSGGTTNVGTRSGETINVGSGTATLSVTATNDTVFTLDAAQIDAASSLALNSPAAKAQIDGDRLEPPHHVRAASTANVASLSGTTTLDGVSVIAADVVLLKNQSTASQNGPWVIAAGSWTRPTWYTTALAAVNMLVLVAEGSTLAGTCWRLATTGTITVGSTSTTWSQFGAGGGGTSITQGGGTVAVDGSGNITLTPVATTGSVTVTTDGGLVVTDSGGGWQLSSTANGLIGAAQLDHSLSGYLVGSETLDGSDWFTLVQDDIGILWTTVDTGSHVSHIDLRSANNFLSWVGSGYSFTRGVGATYSGAREVFDVTSTSARRRLYGTANTLGLTETSNATATTIVAAGTMSIDSASTTYIRAAGSVVFQSDTTTAYAISTYVIANINAAAYFGISESGSFQDRYRFYIPTAITLSSDGTTTVKDVAVGTTRPSTFRGSLRVWDASMNVYVTTFEATRKNISGTASAIGSDAKTDKNDGGGSIASVVTGVTSNGANFRLTAARPTGVTCTACATFHEEL